MVIFKAKNVYHLCSVITKGFMEDHFVGKPLSHIQKKKQELLHQEGVKRAHVSGTPYAQGHEGKSKYQDQDHFFHASSGVVQSGQARHQSQVLIQKGYKNGGHSCWSSHRCHPRCRNCRNCLSCLRLKAQQQVFPLTSVGLGSQAMIIKCGDMWALCSAPLYKHSKCGQKAFAEPYFQTAANQLLPAGLWLKIPNEDQYISSQILL